MHVHLIASGGTISAVPDATGAYTPRLLGADLVERAAALGSLPPVLVHDLSPIPSEHATPEFWRQLAQTVRKLSSSSDTVGIVITHGTDTLEETAFFLDLTVASEKPIILTGAQRPISDPASDGPRNVLHALQAASNPLLRGAGVLVVFDGQIHAARAVTKVHTTSYRAFESQEFGLVASFENDRLRLFHRPPRFRVFERINVDRRVDIIPVYPGADARFVEAALDAGAQGLVVAAYGSGNVNPPIYHALVKAMEAGIPVVICTRVPRGPVFPAYGCEGGGASLARAGGIFARHLPPHKARVLLLVALANGVEGQELAALFDSVGTREPLQEPVSTSAEHRRLG